MQLEHYSFADLIALRQELHERILTCYKKKKTGLSREQLNQMAVDYNQKFNEVAEEIDRRIS